ncbi:MAG: CoA protein activase [Clostridiales bacterium]|nr:CoA protein activase [Clostridiales bacterium]
MVITFPHMGKMYIPVKALFDELGVDIIIPPKINKDTLDIGLKSCPEMACLPLKVTIGNYVESIKRGADTIVLSGSCGPCRFGYYGVIQKEILKDLGYDVDIVILDPPREGLRELIDRLKKISGNCSLYSGLAALSKAFKVSEGVEELLELVLKQRCKEINKGDTDDILSRFEEKVRKVKGANKILDCIQDAKGELSKVRLDSKKKTIKIGLVGEIYTIIEPFVNFDIEKKLGDMGVEVHREMSVDNWVKYHLFPDIKFRRKQKRTLKYAKDYLDLCIGGHAWETIAHALYYARKGMDGIIQIMPFGCMPEIVAESILPTLAKNENIPVMTLVVDELTGEAGYQTRLEAFVDLLQLERSRKENEFGEALSWN